MRASQAAMLDSHRLACGFDLRRAFSSWAASAAVGSLRGARGPLWAARRTPSPGGFCALAARCVCADPSPPPVVGAGAACTGAAGGAACTALEYERMVPGNITVSFHSARCFFSQCPVQASGSAKCGRRYRFRPVLSGAGSPRGIGSVADRLADMVRARCPCCDEARSRRRFSIEPA